MLTLWLDSSGLFSLFFRFSFRLLVSSLWTYVVTNITFFLLTAFLSSVQFSCSLLSAFPLLPIMTLSVPTFHYLSLPFLIIPASYEIHLYVVLATNLLLSCRRAKRSHTKRIDYSDMRTNLWVTISITCYKPLSIERLNMLYAPLADESIQTRALCLGHAFAHTLSFESPRHSGQLLHTHFGNSRRSDQPLHTLQFVSSGHSKQLLYRT